MNGNKAKLFRKIFPTTNKRGWRAFKRAYTNASPAKQLEIIKTARQMKGKKIHHMENPNVG